MTFQQMFYALTIAECGSMNRAAEKLYISQPSLTGAIRELEKDLGIRIFDRTNKGMTPTQEGIDFLANARQVYQQYSLLAEKYKDKTGFKRKFGISTQHYSFVVRVFVDTVREFDTSEFEFSLMETRTRDIISDVADARSELGILFMNEFNEKIIRKLLKQRDLVFTPLLTCNAYVYLYKGHPLAKEKEISMDMLDPYPCIYFDQGDEASSFFAEEILSDNVYPRSIRINDRATSLNLMKGLNGYTLCSGIISGELNGDDYVAVPFREDAENKNADMTIGYIERSHSVRSTVGEVFLKKLREYLKIEE